MEKTRHICRCGGRAVGRCSTTGEWLCVSCTAQEMLKDRARGETVAFTLNGRAINDTLLVPGGDGKNDLLVSLWDAYPLDFHWN